jgi:hypothetical protein
MANGNQKYNELILENVIHNTIAANPDAVAGTIFQLDISGWPGIGG